MELHIISRDAIVDFGADHGVAHAGVDGIGEVNRCRAGRQGDHLASGAEDKHLIVEHVHLEAVEIVFGVGLLLVFQKAANPLKFLFVAALDALLVLPVGRHAVFGRLVHFLGADLHLEGDALGPDDRGVEALVHIGLGGGDIVLEPAGNQVEQVVDMAQHVVAVGDGVHDDPEGVDVVQLVHGLSLSLHLPVDGVDMLDPSVGGVVDSHGSQALGDLTLDGPHEGLVLLLVGLEVGGDLLIFHGGKGAQGGILQFPFDPLHT